MGKWRNLAVGLVVTAVVARVWLYNPEDGHTSFIPLYQDTKDTFPSASAPEVLLHVRKWPTTSKSPKGNIFIAHGYAEYIDRYETVAKFFNDASYNVYGLDHQGHGLSGGDRVHVKKFMDYTTDFNAFVEHINEIQGYETRLPQYLLGHSMGGAVATQTVLARPDLYDGMIASAPALEKLPSALLMVADAVKLVNPKLPLVGLSLDINGLNSDEEKRNVYLNDDLVYHGYMKVGWGSGIISGIYDLYSNIPQWDVSIPVLFLHGLDDTITPITHSRIFFNEIPEATDKTFIEYPETRHELFQEHNKLDILSDIVSWLESRK